MIENGRYQAILWTTVADLVYAKKSRQTRHQDSSLMYSTVGCQRLETVGPSPGMFKTFYRYCKLYISDILYKVIRLFTEKKVTDCQNIISVPYKSSFVRTEGLHCRL